MTDPIERLRNKPDRDGWWDWFEGGDLDATPERLLLVAEGREVADDYEWELATGRSPEHHTYSENYWEMTQTKTMPGKWRYVGQLIAAVDAVVKGEMEQ